LIKSFLEKKKYELILIPLFLIALLLRIYNLGSHNLWFDEYATFCLQSKFNLFELLRLAQYLLGGSLYYILLKPWVIFFGKTEFALRSLSVLFGVLSILLIYKLGKLCFDKKVGLISAFLLTISPLHIWYAQEARPFAMSTFLSMLTVYFFISAIKNNKLTLWISFIVSSILAVYTNYFCFYIPIISAGRFFTKKYRELKHGLLSFCIMIVIVLPLLPILMRQINFTKESFWITKPNLNSIVITFENFNLGYNATAWAYFLVFIFFSFLFILGIRYWCSTKRIELLSLMLFLFVPIIFTYLISQEIPVYIDRHLMPFSPFYYIIIASGISEAKIYFAKLLIFISILLTFSLSIFNYYTYQMPVGVFHHQGVYAKKPFSPAADYINKQFQEGDVIGYSEAEAMPIFYYIQDLIYKPIDIFVFLIKSNLGKYWNTIGSKYGYIHYITGFALPKLHVVGLGIEQSYRNFQKYKFKRIWFITTSWARDGILSPHAMNVRQWLQSHYSILETKEFEGIYIDLYEKNDD